MGEVRDEGDALADWAALAGQSDRYPDLGLPDRLAAAGPPPAPRPGGSLILDTDIGGDPDDAIAVAIAALAVPELALVVTGDEYRGDGRARFARTLLDSLGRPDVPVVAGRDLGLTRYFCVEGLAAGGPVRERDVAAAVARVLAQAGGPVRWVGLAPLSNLAGLLDADPELADQLEITQMGGALAYRDPARAQHNVRLDPAAAVRVLELTRTPTLVTSDVTYRPEIGVRPDGPLHRHLSAAGADVTWARLLREHLDRWFRDWGPETMQHDPLTLSVALGLPFVDLVLRTVQLDPIGRMSLADPGHPVLLSHRADYPAFLRWMHHHLGIGDQTDAGWVPTTGGQA